MNQNPNQEKLNALTTIADLLTDICTQSTTETEMNQKNIKVFISKKIPEIGIKNYLERLMKYTNIEASTLILILIYIDRLCEKNHIRLNYFNIHKLIISAMIISIKYNEDEFYSNDYYGRVGGISKSDADKMEYEFLSLIDFTLYVSDTLYNQYYTYLQTASSNE